MVDSSFRPHVILFVFFFQAEDGIRDLVRSRGLGDVYKRQAVIDEHINGFAPEFFQKQVHLAASGVRENLEGGYFLEIDLAALAEHQLTIGQGETDAVEIVAGIGTVSYTHLTLPTSDLG